MTPALLYSLGNEVETLGHWPSRCDAFLSGAVSYSPHDKEGFHLYGKRKDRTHRLMRMLPALGMLQDVQRPHQRTGPHASMGVSHSPQAPRLNPLPIDRVWTWLSLGLGTIDLERAW